MLSTIACRVFGQMINEAAALFLEASAERRETGVRGGGNYSAA